MRHFKNREYLVSLGAGLFLLLCSFFINAYAVNYADRSVSNSVTDIVLSNTPVFNVDGIFVYGAILLALCIAIAGFIRPQRMPFILKSLALFTLIRSFFISLTHISPYPAHIAISPNIFTAAFPSIFTGNDLFFSGHVGIPFLMALILWDYPFWRVLFLGFSVLFGVVVLLGHLHYSIDVASAFFITFTIFMIAVDLFKKDWSRLKKG